MADFTDPLTPGSYTPSQDWLNRLLRFQRKVAKLDERQTFTATQKIADGAIQNTNILLMDGGFDTLVNIGKVTANATQGTGIGGRAAAYIQHQVDNGVSAVSVVNCGIRVQLETSQQVAAGVGVNDAVAGYFGLYNNGVNVGGFGYHVDAYHAGSGANITTYGGSSEMRRTSGLGWTAGYHTRSISQGTPPGPNYLDNDYGFLCSPGGPVSNAFSPARQTGFMAAFSVGSIFTGTMRVAFGLDMRFAQVTDSGIYMLDDVRIAWGDNLQTHTRAWKGASAGRMEYDFNGTRRFSISDAGIAEFGSAGIFNTSSGASGKFLQVTDTSGGVWKIALNLN